MEKKVLSYIKDENMIRPGSRGILAVSGGADSMCLMHILHRLSGELQTELTVCHVHHGIRGEEADRDAAFVEKTAKELGLPCRIYHRDVPALAKAKGETVEEAGREARYACLEELKEECGADWIALAHQSDDQAETVLFNILRGTGIRGLRGIHAVREDRIRPLLPFSRKEIEAWLRAEGLEWCTDSTNLEPYYTRNFLRTVLLPMLTEVNAGAKEHLVLLAKEAEELYDIQEAEEGRLMALCTVIRSEDGKIVEIPDRVFEENKTLLGELLLRELELLAGKRKDLTRRHIQAIEELAARETGKRVDLPYDLEAVRWYGSVLLRKRGVLVSSDTGKRLSVSREAYEPGMEIPAGEDRKLVDAASVRGTIALRTPERGDRITVDREGGTKLLTRLFTDRKIPRELRDSWPVVADDEKVLWVVGLRLSEACKVTDETEEVYLLRIEE